jgi:flagellar FliJ protein
MLRQAELQLEQLVTYREDYSRQFSGSVGGVMQGATLNGYRAFLAGLNRAIDDQNQKIRQRQSECEASAQRWHETKSRSNALGKATDKIRHLEAQDASRQEQRTIDDLVNAARH